MMKTAGTRFESGSISQRYGSADPDPDAHQNIMDPQHWETPSFPRTGADNLFLKGIVRPFEFEGGNKAHSIRYNKLEAWKV
jgi:hypothetical protein